MCFGATQTAFLTPWPVMSAHDVCLLGGVVISLDFLAAQTVTLSAAMKLTALLVLRMPASVELL